MSSVRPPSRPPPSRSEPVEAPTGAPVPTPPSQPPPSQATAPRRPARPRRRWLAAAVVGALAVAAGTGALVLGGADDVSDEDRSFFSGQYKAARANVAQGRGTGVCAVADSIRLQILGSDGQLPMVFESYRSDPWDVGSVVSHVAFAESLVGLLNTEHGTPVPQLSDLERRWNDEVRYPLDAKGWRLDDDDVSEILALLDETLATVDAAPFLATCADAPTATTRAAGSKGPVPAPSGITIDRT